MDEVGDRTGWDSVGGVKKEEEGENQKIFQRKNGRDQGGVEGEVKGCV